MEDDVASSETAWLDDSTVYELQESESLLHSLDFSAMDLASH